MKRSVTVAAALLGCDGPAESVLDAPPAVDAANVSIDGRPIDAMPPLPDCTPSGGAPPPAAAVAPVAGAYCATWTRIDGQQDAFARYYDRADVTLTGVRWWSSGSGGAKEYVARAAVGTTDCLVVEPFASPDGWSGSGPLALCWATASEARAAMGWCSTGLSDAHWTVRLAACP